MVSAFKVLKAMKIDKPVELIELIMHVFTEFMLAIHFSSIVQF